MHMYGHNKFSIQNLQLMRSVTEYVIYTCLQRPVGSVTELQPQSFGILHCFNLLDHVIILLVRQPLS